MYFIMQNSRSLKEAFDFLQQAKHWCWVLAKKACFANCNFSDFFYLQIINASQPFWFIA